MGLAPSTDTLGLVNFFYKYQKFSSIHCINIMKQCNENSTFYKTIFKKYQNNKKKKNSAFETGSEFDFLCVV